MDKIISGMYYDVNYNITAAYTILIIDQKNFPFLNN